MNNKKLEKLEKQVKFLSNQNFFHSVLITTFLSLPMTAQEKEGLLILYLILTIIDVITIAFKKGEK